jgi:hypothetical protein
LLARAAGQHSKVLPPALPGTGIAQVADRRRHAPVVVSPALRAAAST